ncbi:hypothetical protein MLC59_09045 [Marinobacter bryozoorum]|uniref:hypothetical protein n=1 Tax=Marinobacter bryozoorum TaxID=256324 RepID=UPI0020058990|nr:hypothetical protein [Marinobacter bryozoorum]MCK7544311.1 hypothetical protein [Marinobacter bryozoorum]
MSTRNQSIVQQAATHFRSGQYAQAKDLYQQAARQFGEAAFKHNIRLCERRLGSPLKDSHTQAPDVKETPKPVPVEAISVPKQPTPTAEQQLAETQKLLEHYYTRCQELEYQLQDRN